MAIKQIDIYPQIYAYTKDYVDALVADPTTEPVFSGDTGAWFGLKTDDKILQYTMNPCLVDENAAPLTIYNVPQSATQDIASIISYQNIVEYFKYALIGGIAISGSDTYVTIDSDGVNFVFPTYSTNPVLLPMRLRFFYRVTYGEDNLVAMFPTEINGYYETVLNATRSFQFTTATAGARWGAEPEWKLFTKTGEQIIDSATGLNTSLTSDSEEFYIAVNVPILGKANATSVNHYDINNFFLDNGNGVVISTTNNYPGGSNLSALMATEGSSWKWSKSDSGGKTTYDNAEHYLASARFSRTILFKVLPYQCLELITNPTLSLTYLDPPAIDTCATGYTTSLTIDISDLTLSSDGMVLLGDSFSSPYSYVSIGNPSEQLIDDITYSLKMKKYAIRTKNTSTEVIDSWGSLITIAGDGIDMSGDCDIFLPSSISAGASDTGYITIGYDEISDFANKCEYVLQTGKSIASGIFIFELEMSYGAATKTTQLAFRLGYEHCISMRTTDVHEILQDSSKKWSGIKNVALTIDEVSDSETLNKIESLNSLYGLNASLNYVSPVSKTITSDGINSFGSNGSIGSYATMTGTTTKTVTLAGNGGMSWASTHYANLQTGSAYLSMTLRDDDGSFLAVHNPSRTIDIVAPPMFDITTTPDGSEIDDNSEAGFGDSE